MHHAAARSQPTPGVFGLDPPVSLRAFLHEFRITFPVGVDAPSGDERDPIPVTMQSYRMSGTPSLVLIDRNGYLRHHAFGTTDDLALGAAIATLIAEGGR